MKEQIKELRIKIDGLYQLTKELKPITGLEEQIVIGSNIVWDKKAPRNSKQIEDAAHSLIYAKSWLGKVLSELGEQTPYTNDGNRKTVDDIEFTADKPVNVSNNIGENTWYNGNFNATESKGDLIIEGKHWSDFNHIEKVDWLRTEIEILVKEVKQIGNPPNPPMLNREASIARTNAYNHLCEARFALGFELQIIKEENK